MTRGGLFFLIATALAAAPRFSKLPLVFEQAPDSQAFVARSGDWRMLIRGNETVFAADGRDRVRVRLLGANPRARLQGMDAQSGHSNYLTGRNTTLWRTNVAQYARVEANEVYPGISVVYYGHARELEHDFVIAPGADPARIRMEVEGAHGMDLDAHGNLVIRTREGAITESKPEIYQPGERGQKLIVDGSFRRIGRRQIGFEVAAYDRTKPLIIDPVLTYGAYLGGAGDDISQGIALDSAGNVYITGSTTSTDFLTRNPLQSKSAGGVDAFVTKFSPAGTLIYSTYFGGSLEDRGVAIAADSGGNAYVTGLTYSLNFPTTDHAFQRNAAGVFDGFVTKLNASGSALVYSTYLGGQAEDLPHSIAIDSAGNAYVTGTTSSSGFPLSSGAPQKSYAGLGDAFLTKLDVAGSVVYSTFLGGNDEDTGNAVAVDSAGSAYITGSTKSTNFPALQPLQGPGGGMDAFFAQINPAGTGWVRISVLGGTGNDTGYSIAADATRVWIVGWVKAIKDAPAPSFPTTANAYQRTYGGGDSDGFAVALSGGTLVYATFLGREGSESGQSARMDATSFWATLQNVGTLTPALGSRVPGNNPPSLCGGSTDSTALLQLDAQFRPVSESCINFVNLGLALGDGARLALSGAASPTDTFSTSTPPPAPPLGTAGSSIATFNGGAFDAAFQLLSTSTPPANLEGFFPLTLNGAPGPALAVDFDGTGGANDVLASGANMASLTSMFNISATGPVTVADTFITTPLASTPLIPTGSTVLKDAVTGRNDVALAGIPSTSGQTGAGQILVGINNGHGGFGGLQPLVASPGVANLLHGDFNNDGFDDLGYVDFNTNAAAIALSDGQSGFRLPAFRETGGLVAVSAATADFDDDGNLDVAVLSQGAAVAGPTVRFLQSGISLLRGQGDGTLQPSRGLQVADLGMAMVGGLSDIESNGTRRVVDFNNDGFADLAVVAVRDLNSGFTDPIVTVMLNQPDNPGTFTATPAQGVDGVVLPQTAPQARGATPVAELGAGTILAASVGVTQEMFMSGADFDRDGNWDLAVLNPSANTLSILKGDGRGGLTQAGTYLVGRSPVSISVADLNNDKMPDLVVANKDSRSVQVFVNRNPPPAVENLEISAAGILNAASFQGGGVSPGEIVTMFGSGMGPAIAAGLQLDAQGKAATQVAGTRVLFDGVAAPIVYTSAGQLSAIVPYSVAGKAHTVIQVEYQGRRSNRVARPVVLFRPALFTANSSGKGQAAVLNQNSELNSGTNPADKGSIVVLYATGEGQTNPPGVDGLVAGAVAPKPLFPVRVKIGGVDADVVYYGAAPGLVSGVLQVNAVVPPGTASGVAVPVTISVGAVNSPAGTTLAVR